MVSVLKKGKLMKLTPTSSGYLCVGLFKNKKVGWKLVHRIVAELFLPKIEGKEHVNHKDSNRANNRVDNIEWCTPAENRYHAKTYGGLNNISPKAFVSDKCHFTDEQIIEILNFKRTSGLYNYKIAEIYNVGRRTIDRIISRQAYTWVKLDTGL
jgi:hypothetical protein